jgi:hypothetical protein
VTCLTSYPANFRSRMAPLWLGSILVASVTLLTWSSCWGAEATDTCSLLTAEEISAALHERIQAPQSMPFSGCLWRGSGTDSVTVEAPGTGRPGFDNAEQRVSPIIPLSGIGDAAFAFVSAAGFVEIGLLKADGFFTVLVQMRDAKAARSAAEVLAAKIAGRI